MSLGPLGKTHRSASISFWSLLFFYAVLQVAVLFVFTFFILFVRYQPTENKVIKQVAMAVAVATAFPQDQSKVILGSMEQSGYRLTLVHKPMPDVMQMAVFDRGAIASVVKANPSTFKMYWALSGGRGLLVQGQASSHPWIWFGFIFSGVVFLLLLWVVTLWAVKRLVIPVDAFESAAVRFGVDVNAPPLAVLGPPDVQALAHAFNEMQNRIRRLIQDRTQMLAAISHDLRTPITRLKLRMEYVKDKKQYQRAIEDLAQMDEMITSILSFARDHAREENMRVFDFNGLLESLCDDLSDAGKSVSYKGLDARLAFYGRFNALKRAFASLIDNAVKYGKVAHVVLRSDERGVWVDITDQGPGISDLEKDRVFTPFYRVDPARSPEQAGTGLGMAVSRDIVLASGGDITLKDHMPQGLWVEVFLPVQPKPEVHEA